MLRNSPGSENSRKGPGDSSCAFLGTDWMSCFDEAVSVLIANGTAKFDWKGVCWAGELMTKG